MTAYKLWQRDQRARKGVLPHEGRCERRRARRLHLLLRGRHGRRLPGRPLAPRRQRCHPRRMGPGRTVVRHLGHLVPARRRPLHGVHLRRRTRGHLRRGRCRVLRRAVHDPGLPADLHLPAAALVGLAQARVRDDVGLRPGALRLQGALAGRRGHRHPRHDAVHRAPAGRHPGGARRDGRRRFGQQLVRQGPPAADRLRGARRVHVLVGAASPRPDRLRQGRPDLHRHPGGDHLHPHQTGGFDDIFAKAYHAFSQTNPATGKPRGALAPGAASTSGVTPRSRSGRPSRCSCTRTRSRRRSPRAAAT